MEQLEGAVAQPEGLQFSTGSGQGPGLGAEGVGPGLGAEGVGPGLGAEGARSFVVSLGLRLRKWACTVFSSGARSKSLTRREMA